MKFDEVLTMIETIAPTETQEERDNSGPQLVLPTAKINGVSRVLVCLEISDQVIDEAEEKQVDLIITHHPLIFGEVSVIDSHTVMGAYIIKLINLGISVYSSHTPFDKANGGNNDDLAQRIGLQDTSGLSRNGELEMIGRVGRFPEGRLFGEAVQDLLQKLELQVQDIRLVGDMDTPIRTVAVCAGSGATLMDLAFENGCQLFITGDVKYHDAQKAKALGLCVVDAGHYGTERFFAENFAQKLRSQGGDRLEVMESEVELDPFTQVKNTK